jgi:plasmid stabilization system protein ParE
MLRIWRWIRRDSPAAADRTLTRISEVFRLIMQFPESGASRPELGHSVRVIPVGNYLVIYRLDERGPLVLRVVHGAMDLTQIHIP